MSLKKLMNKSFLTRAISGIVLVIIILIAGIIGKDVLLGLTAVISLIGLFELYRVVNIEKSLLGLVGYLSSIIYYGVIRFTDGSFVVPTIIGMILLCLAVYVFTFPKYETQKVLMAIFGVIYVPVLMSYLYLIRMTNDGIYTFWLVFIGSWICDTFAYLTGVTCGKHKMAPVLSPKKSVEGAIGGVVGAGVVGAIYGAIIGPYLKSVSHPVIAFAVMCAIAGLVSMVGDLSASAIKRNYEIKDYGKLIPGHGGILDRFDSVIFIAPVIFYILLLFSI